MAQIELLLSSFSRWIADNKRILFWLVCGLLLLWLMFEVKELTSLLLLSYAIALLMDPLLTRLEQRKIPRSISILALGALVIVALLVLLLVILPSLIDQYNRLIEHLPFYVERFISKVQGTAQKLHINMPADTDAVVARVQEWASSIGIEQLRSVGRAFLDALLQGYSFTLTLLNLVLLPFFVFYLGRDLQDVHRFLGAIVRNDIEGRIKTVADQIITHTRVFFKGQITVCVIDSLLYAAGLWIVGLPNAVLVGLLTGLLNVIPYFGLTLGVILGTIISLVTASSFGHLLAVWAVFGAVQAIDGAFLTPKIIGEKMGIHPLVVMIALIIGGKLFGLLGLILAIPAAATLRVLIPRIRQHVETA